MSFLVLRDDEISGEMRRMEHVRSTFCSFLAVNLEIGANCAEYALKLKGPETQFLGRLMTGHRVVEMGHEILPGLSPAHRRTSSAPSPSPFRKLSSREDQDLGWCSLARRHKFLLTMLGILTFLCTVYLYFAITLGTSDSCSGMGGTQRALCLLASKNGEDSLHTVHHRRLMFVEDSDSSSGRGGGKQNLKEFTSLLSSFANRKGLKENMGHATPTPVSVDEEQWTGDIVKYKAMLDSVQKEKPKSDNKLFKSTHLRGNQVG